jgi:hypothetical protein
MPSAIRNGQLAYPAYRCAECSRMVMYAPGTCNDCLHYQGKPPVPVACYCPQFHPWGCHCPARGV